MADNDSIPGTRFEKERKRKGGRPPGRKVKPNAKPLASGQIEPIENDALNEVAKRTGQTRSELVRRAVVIMLNADINSEVFFGSAIQYRGKPKGESHRIEIETTNP